MLNVCVFNYVQCIVKYTMSMEMLCFWNLLKCNVVKWKRVVHIWRSQSYCHTQQAEDRLGGKNLLRGWTEIEINTKGKILILENFHDRV